MSTRHSISLGSIAQWLSSAINKRLKARGVAIQHVSPEDLRSTSTDPRDVILDKSSLLKRRLLLDIPITKCRNFLGIVFSKGHPFVETLLPVPPARYPGSVLERYYQSFQPGSALEVLGLSDPEAPGFIDLPPTAYCLPWTSSDPALTPQRRAKYILSDALEHGIPLDISHGYSHFGPISCQKGDLELERLKKVYHSISNNGFLRSDKGQGDIHGTMLIDASGGWCVFVSSGHHRLAAAAAHGLSSVPILFSKSPIQREEVNYWPQVAAGRITREGALAVFDRIMRGDPPPTCQFDATALVHEDRKAGEAQKVEGSR